MAKGCSPGGCAAGAPSQRCVGGSGRAKHNDISGTVHYCQRVRNESAAFTVDDLESFLAELVLTDRDALVARLEQAGRRLQTMAARVPGGAGADPEWNPHDVLAHIAVLSKFYGVLVHRVASGAMAELDLLANVNLRDAAGAQLAATGAAELAAMALADQRRTADYLRGLDATELRRAATLTHGGSLAAIEIARLPLVAHLEQHLDQLESLLQTATRRR